jgi:hypothetical protein
MVTLLGSPPNLVICFCTHSRANFISSIPALRTPFALTSLEDRKPKAPSYILMSDIMVTLKTTQKVKKNRTYPILN